MVLLDLDATLELKDSVSVRLRAGFILLEDFAAHVVAVFSDIGRPLFVFGLSSFEVFDLEGPEVNLPVEALTGPRIDLLESAFACA